MVLSALTAERDEARAIARRWHETVREMDGEFYSLKSQALHELLADAATIAGWVDPQNEVAHGTVATDSNKRSDE